MRFIPPEKQRFSSLFLSAANIQGFALSVLVLFPNVRGAGMQKSNLFSNTDPTFLLAFPIFFVSTLCVLSAKSRGFPPIGAISRLLAMFLLFLPGVFLASWGSKSMEKICMLYTMTLLTSFAPLFLLRSKKELRYFLNWLSSIGFLIAVIGLIHGTASAGGRVSALGTNAIGFARNASIPFLWMTVLGISESGWSLAFLFLALIPLRAILISGSRGPLLASAIALFFGILAFYRKKILTPKLLFLGLVSITILATILMTSNLLDGLLSKRVTQFLSGKVGASELARKDAVLKSVEILEGNPIGIGWGGFLELGMWREGEVVPYPHNIIVEVFLEGGWIAGIWFSWLILSSFFRAFTATDNTENRGAFILFLCFFLNALVSGDVNTNRIFSLFLGWAAREFAIRKQPKDLESNYQSYIIRRGADEVF